MSYIKIAILILVLHANVFAKHHHKYTSRYVPKHMSVKTKKERFFYLLVPQARDAYKKLFRQYIKIKQNIKDGKNKKTIQKLKKKYHVKSNHELLLALKPHPPSIVLAQAAMESAWGTSRFFTQANNVFGMWSVNKNEHRVLAKETRNGGKKIWIRGFRNIEDSIFAYYRMMARAKQYKAFRDVRYNSNDVFEMVKKLDKYSEKGKLYTKEIANIIRHNNLTKYDNFTSLPNK